MSDGWDRDGDDDSRADQSEWETATRGYSPDKLYTRATDTHGHSDHIKLRVPTWMAAKLREIAAAKGIGTHDAVRDYIVHSLIRDEKRNPDDPVFRIPNDVMVALEVERLAGMRERWIKSLEAIESEVTAAMAMNDYEAAHYMLEQAQTVTESDISDAMLVKWGTTIQRLSAQLSVQEATYNVQVELQSQQLRERRAVG